MSVRPARRWIAVVLVLVLVDLVVRGRFFNDVIARRYVSGGLLPRERTNGHNWRAIFDGAARLPRPMLRIGIVGDSTVNGTEGIADDAAPAWFLQEAVRRRLPGVTVGIVDVSEIGLYAKDAVFLMNKLMVPEYDVLVYGLTLRALPAIPPALWATHLTNEINPSELLRLSRVGGGEWLRGRLSGSEVLNSLVQSVWATYAYREFLKRWVWDTVARPLLERWPQVLEATRPASFAPPLVQPRALLPGQVEWTRERYGIPNSNWTALEIMGRLCERYAPNRCLVYSGPINPLGRDYLAEPGLYEEYSARLRVIAGRFGLHFRDFTDTLEAGDFRKPMFFRPGDAQPRDPIHMNRQGGAKLSEFLADAVVEVAAPILRSKPSVEGERSPLPVQ